jgi:hypothetical protein
MTTAALDPKLEKLANQIEGAFAGGGAGKGFEMDGPSTTVVHDACSMASSLLSAYHVAATVNPAKAFKAKAFAPTVQVADPLELGQKAWWNTVLDIIQTTAPVVINALSKDFQPKAPTLEQVIQGLPEQRRNDKDFVDYATTLLLTLGQATVQSMSGQKDFSDPATALSIPQPPPGKDKGWFDDVCDFVSDAAPIALPIIMSLI